MLQYEVVEAVQAGRFHIWAVETIDEGIELLTGRPAGERQADSTYPEESVNALVEKRLRDSAERLPVFASTDGAAVGAGEKVLGRIGSPR